MVSTGKALAGYRHGGFSVMEPRSRAFRIPELEVLVPRSIILEASFQTPEPVSTLSTQRYCQPGVHEHTMAHSHFFSDQYLTREPSSYYALDNGPNAYPVHPSQKSVPYGPYPYYLPHHSHQVQPPVQPRVLSDMPGLDDFFYEPPLNSGVNRAEGHTASPAPSPPPHVHSGPAGDQISRSISSPENSAQCDHRAPSVTASHSVNTSSTVSNETPSCVPPESLKKSSSAQATFSDQSQNEGGLSRQPSQHGSVHENSPQPDYVPSFPQPEHHHYPPHANSAPPAWNGPAMHDSSAKPQECHPQGNQARNNVCLGHRNPSSGVQHAPRDIHPHPGVPNDYRRQYSSGPLTANDIRPDMQSFEAMLQALQDFGACKEIFDSMSKELDQLGTNARNGGLESGVVDETNALRDASAEALQSAERLVNAYDGFARALDARLAVIARTHRGGPLFPCDDIDVLSREITLSASALTHHVERMQDRVRGLLAMIDSLKDKRDRKEQRRRIWTWLERALVLMSTVFTAGACLAPLFGPYGILAGAVLAGVAPLCAALSTFCQKQAASLSEEEKLDNFLVFLRGNLLTEARAAEIKLTSFPPLQLVHQAALNAHSDSSRGWISSEEANRARIDWSEWFRRFDQEKSANSKQRLRNGTIA